jgi:hypothetical protein
MTHTWLTSPTRNLWLIFSDSQVQKRSCRMNRTLDGMVSRLVLKVEKPRAFRVRVR